MDRSMELETIGPEPASSGESLSGSGQVFYRILGQLADEHERALREVRRASLSSGRDRRSPLVRPRPPSPSSHSWPPSPPSGDPIHRLRGIQPDPLADHHSDDESVVEVKERPQENPESEVPELEAVFPMSPCRTEEEAEAVSSTGKKKRVSFTKESRNSDRTKSLSFFSEATESCTFETYQTWKDMSAAINRAVVAGPLSRPRNVQQAAKTMYHEANADIPVIKLGSEPLYVEDSQSCMMALIRHPNDPYRLVWDLIGSLLISFDIILIPMAVFDLPQNTFLTMIDWVTLLFWSADIPVSFFVGYVDRGTTVLMPSKIAKNYLRTWFLPDVIIVAADWTYNFANVGSGDAADIGRTARIMRSVRALRLVRLLKLKRIIADIKDHIDSEYMSIIGDICKLILMTLLLSHVIGCVWYAIGRAGPGGGWIAASGYEDTTLGWRYTTSLHWSLTQLMLESMDVTGGNIYERTFTICTLVFGLLIFSSVVSRVTSSMIQLQTLTDQNARQFWLLRRFFRERQVPKALSARIQRYLEYAIQKQSEHVQEINVKILSLLSNQLSDELQFAITVPQLSTHPLFEYISKVSDVTMHRLARSAITRKDIASEDSVFFNTEIATHMYYVTSGELVYLKNSNMDPEMVGREQWICEPSLWTPWTHLGDLHATTECDLISIDAHSFGEVVQKNSLTCQLAATYAASYVEMLNKKERHELTDIRVASDEIPLPSIDDGESKDEEPVKPRASMKNRLSTLYPMRGPSNMMKVFRSSWGLSSSWGEQGSARVVPCNS